MAEQEGAPIETASTVGEETTSGRCQSSPNESSPGEDDYDPPEEVHRDDDGYDDHDLYYEPKPPNPNLQGDQVVNDSNKTQEVQKSNAPTRTPTKSKETRYPTSSPTHYPIEGPTTRKPTKPLTLVPAVVETEQPFPSPTVIPPPVATAPLPLSPDATATPIATQNSTTLVQNRTNEDVPPIGLFQNNAPANFTSSSTFFIAGIVGISVLALLSIGLLAVQFQRRRRQSLRQEQQQQRTTNSSANSLVYTSQASTTFHPRVAGGGDAQSNSSSRPWFVDDSSVDEYTCNNTMGDDDDAHSLDFSLEAQSVM